MYVPKERSMETYPSSNGSDPSYDMLLDVLDNAGQDLATNVLCSLDSSIYQMVDIPA